MTQPNRKIIWLIISSCLLAIVIMVSLWMEPAVMVGVTFPVGVAVLLSGLGSILAAVLLRLYTYKTKYSVDYRQGLSFGLWFAGYGLTIAGSALVVGVVVAYLGGLTRPLFPVLTGVLTVGVVSALGILSWPYAGWIRLAACWITEVPGSIADFRSQMLATLDLLSRAEAAQGLDPSVFKLLELLQVSPWVTNPPNLWSRDPGAWQIPLERSLLVGALQEVFYRLKATMPVFLAGFAIGIVFALILPAPPPIRQSLPPDSSAQVGTSGTNQPLLTLTAGGSPTAATGTQQAGNSGSQSATQTAAGASSTANATGGSSGNGQGSSTPNGTPTAGAGTPQGGSGGAQSATQTAAASSTANGTGSSSGGGQGSSTPNGTPTAGTGTSQAGNNGGQSATQAAAASSTANATGGSSGSGHGSSTPNGTPTAGAGTPQAGSGGGQSATQTAAASSTANATGGSSGSGHGSSTPNGTPTAGAGTPQSGGSGGQSATQTAAASLTSNATGGNSSNGQGSSTPNGTPTAATGTSQTGSGGGQSATQTAAGSVSATAAGGGTGSSQGTGTPTVEIGTSQAGNSGGQSKTQTAASQASPNSTGGAGPSSGGSGGDITPTGTGQAVGHELPTPEFQPTVPLPPAHPGTAIPLILPTLHSASGGTSTIATASPVATGRFTGTPAASPQAGTQSPGSSSQSPYQFLPTWIRELLGIK